MRGYICARCLYNGLTEMPSRKQPPGTQSEVPALDRRRDQVIARMNLRYVHQTDETKRRTRSSKVQTCATARHPSCCQDHDVEFHQVKNVGMRRGAAFQGNISCWVIKEFWHAGVPYDNLQRRVTRYPARLTARQNSIDSSECPPPKPIPPARECYEGEAEWRPSVLQTVHNAHGTNRRS